MSSEILFEVKAGIGFITLNRPQALNALSLSMVRLLTHQLNLWRDDANLQAVAIRGSNKHGAFGAFCAGGDIRYFHQAALSGDPSLEDFFTEEYHLNHLIHHFPKPYIAFIDGVVMGGGMGISQGGSLRIATERTKMAMPETLIGLFPDVGGGYFLSRCKGHIGEYLALTGQTLGGADAVHLGLADQLMASSKLTQAWDLLAQESTTLAEKMIALRELSNPETQQAQNSQPSWLHAELNEIFSSETVLEIANKLQSNRSEWARQVLQTLRQRSPLMLNVVLEQIRLGRQMSLADDLRMERNLVRHCFFTRHLQRYGSSSETVEGIRALAVDKDHQPHWNPSLLEEVTPEMVQGFFQSPWPADAHPLRHLD